MSIASSFEDTPHFSLGETLTMRLRHVPRVAWLIALAAVAFVGAQQIALALQTPAQTIRNELQAAAAETRSRLNFQLPTVEDQKAIAQHFHAYPVTVETARLWPQVKVTFHGLDRNACLEAQRVARRMEGLVVIDLQGYRLPSDCMERNDMSWWIMP